jgi:UDP-2,3-diacylglucosamine hydrolase
VMASVKASVLAIEADRTVLLDREIVLDKARSARIAIVGIAKLAPSGR